MVLIENIPLDVKK